MIELSQPIIDTLATSKKEIKFTVPMTVVVLFNPLANERRFVVFLSPCSSPKSTPAKTAKRTSGGTR